MRILFFYINKTGHITIGKGIYLQKSIFEYLNQTQFNPSNVLFLMIHPYHKQNILTFKHIPHKKLLISLPSIGQFIPLLKKDVTRITLTFILMSILGFNILFQHYNDTNQILEKLKRDLIAKRHQNENKTTLSIKENKIIRTIFNLFPTEILYYIHIDKSGYILSIILNEASPKSTKDILKKLQKELPTFSHELYSYNADQHILTFQGIKE